MTPEFVAEFTAMYNAGATNAEMKERFGMTGRMLDYRRCKLGLPPRTTVRTMPDNFVEYVTQPGILMIHICTKFKCSNELANRWLDEAGIVLISKRKPLPDDWHQVVGTMTANHLSHHYGVANTVIKRWLRETNTKPKEYIPSRDNKKPPKRRTGFRLPTFAKVGIAPVRSDEASQAAHYLRKFYSNVFRCDIMFDERRTWGEKHKLPNRGKGLYHVDRVGILANNAVIELAKTKGWRQHAELDS